MKMTAGAPRMDMAMAMPMSMGMEKHSFKVVFVGDRASGKTTFLLRHLNGGFSHQYTPTLGVAIHQLTFNTNYGCIAFNCWDTAGQSQNDYAMADAGVVFFDVSNHLSATHVSDWCKNIQSTVGNIPIVICGNKVDLQVGSGKRMVRLYLDKHPNILYYDVSTKSKYNFMWPFLGLARKLTGHDDLVFI